VKRASAISKEQGIKRMRHDNECCKVMSNKAIMANNKAARSNNKATRSNNKAAK
jgi:hypothetical protein